MADNKRITMDVDDKRSDLFYFLLLIALIAFFTIGIYTSNQDEKRLDEHGKLTKGVVTKRMRNARGSYIKYLFYVRGRGYTSVGNIKSSSPLFKGDSVDIIYYSKDPEINRLSSELNR